MNNAVILFGGRRRVFCIFMPFSFLRRALLIPLKLILPSIWVTKEREDRRVSLERKS